MRVSIVMIGRARKRSSDGVFDLCQGQLELLSTRRSSSLKLNGESDECAAKDGKQN